MKLKKIFSYTKKKEYPDFIKRKFFQKVLMLTPALAFFNGKALADSKVATPNKTSAEDIPSVEMGNIKSSTENTLGQDKLPSLLRPDGIKYVGQCLCADDLREIVPSLPGQRITLASFHRQGWGGVHYPVGGGELYSVKSKELKDNSGTIFRVDDTWCWIRDTSGQIDAQWFGVTGDAIAREQEISNAIDFIVNNGGVLLFPSGEVNFGKLRKRIEYFEGIKKFTISGRGSSTTFTFDNIDPPERKIGEDWTSEPNLLVIVGKSTNEYIDTPVIENLNFDYSRQRNLGGTDLTSLEQCHPIPHSKGTTAIVAFFCLNPIFRNIRFNNIYGNGIYCRKCFNPLSENLSFFNVSANQIITRYTKRMDRDSTGGAVFYWSCFSGKITNCVAWNTRTYAVDYKSPDNSQQIRGTLCGYIGFWSEFGSARLNENHLAPPMVDWLNNKSLTSDRVSRGIEISNCIVYGYVIGIKGEAAVDISIINNKVLNCYLPITCSGVRGVIERNFTDMLDAEDVKCPQGGLESRRSHLGGITFTKADKANQSLEISHNYVRTKNYPPFTACRLNLKFLYNYINIYGRAKLFDTFDVADVYGLEITGNTYVIDQEATPEVSIIRNNSKILFEKNTLTINCQKAIHVSFLNSPEHVSYIDFSDNNLIGPISLDFHITANIEKNIFLAPEGVGERLILIAGNDSLIKDNIINSKSSWNNYMLDVNANNIRIEYNKFLILDTGKGKTEGAINFRNDSSMIALLNNKIEGNRYDLSLINANSLQMLTLSSNGSDGHACLINIKEKLFGPVFVYTPNRFVGGLFSAQTKATEPNKIENLWADYLPLPGDKINYLLPNPLGKEGIIMTINGWKEFGNIDN